MVHIVREREDMIAKNLVCAEHKNETQLLPKVFLKLKVSKDTCVMWEDSLVVKLLDKKLRLQYYEGTSLEGLKASRWIQNNGKMITNSTC